VFTAGVANDYYQKVVFILPQQLGRFAMNVPDVVEKLAEGFDMGIPPILKDFLYSLLITLFRVSAPSFPGTPADRGGVGAIDALTDPLAVHVPSTVAQSEANTNIWSFGRRGPVSGMTRVALSLRWGKSRITPPNLLWCCAGHGWAG
jgi:hypothetical protein